MIQQISYETKELRNNYAQKKYCEESQSIYKDQKVVSHTIDLELFTIMLNSSPRILYTQEIFNQIREVANHRDNLQIVYPESNDEHQVILNSLMKKIRNGEKLTLSEKNRISCQQKVLDKHGFKLPFNLLLKFRWFYSQFTTL